MKQLSKLKPDATMCNMDYRKRVQSAIHKHCVKQDPTRKKRKNNKPELETQKECLSWARGRGWSLDVVEAKGGNAYGVVTVKAGFPDSVGCMPSGRCVYLEFKAKGSRNKVRPNQFEFLKDKIETTDAFVIVADSATFLEEMYIQYSLIDTKEKRQDFLLEILPNPTKKDTPLEW